MLNRTPNKLETISLTLGSLALATGVSVLAAWRWDVEWLQTVFRAGAPMRPFAALAIVLLGFSLLLQCRTSAPRLRDAPLAERCRRIVAKLAAAAVMVFGLAALSQHVFGWDLGIDRWLFEEKLRHFPFANPHRLPPGAALCLTFVAAALLGLDAETARGRRPAQAFLISALLVSYLVITGYLFQGSWLFPTAVNSGMALHAALALMLLSVGALCARPRHSLIALLGGDSPGGVLARRLLPLTVIVPMALGWLKYIGEEHGVFGNASGTALLSTVITLVFGLQVWVTTRRVDRAEAERKRAEEALQRSEEQFRTLVESSPNALVMVDAEGRIRFANQRTEEMFGYTATELLGQTVEMLLPERFRTRHPDLRAAYAAAPSHRALGAGRHLFGLRKDGREVPLEIGLSPMQTAAGSFILATLTDITARKQAEAALRGARERTANILESIGDGFFSLDRQWRVTHINEKGARLLGKTREEMLGRNLWELFPEALGSRFQKAYERVLAEQVSITLQEFYPPMNKWFEVRAYPSVEGLSVFYADVTEQKNAEHELREARDKLARYAENLEAAVAARTRELEQTVHDLETFSYSMSHDLRAPLRAVQGFTQMIELDFGETLGAEGRDYLARITAAIGRMDRLINDVLICTKLSREEIKMHPLDVEAFIRQLMAERPAWQPPQSDIQIESPLLPVRGAESFLGQCVTNLVENALKFVPPGQTPHIRIRSEARGDCVRLWFDDDGIGIPKESHSQLFKMFSRLHPQANYEGTGIGLYIVRVAAARMGGRVGVESDTVGGSRFWLELPRGENT